MTKTLGNKTLLQLARTMGKKDCLNAAPSRDARVHPFDLASGLIVASPRMSCCRVCGMNRDY
jgi:hypothetical protein